MIAAVAKHVVVEKADLRKDFIVLPLRPFSRFRDGADGLAYDKNVPLPCRLLKEAGFDFPA
jgi:hypothetical protein